MIQDNEVTKFEKCLFRVYYEPEVSKKGLENPYSEKPETSGRFAPEILKTLPGSDTAKMQELKIKLDRIIYDKHISKSLFKILSNEGKQVYNRVKNVLR